MIVRKKPMMKILLAVALIDHHVLKNQPLGDSGHQTLAQSATRVKQAIHNNLHRGQ